MSAPQALRTSLFANPATFTYAVLDGAAVSTLLDHLYADQPEFECLYRGKLEPDMAEVAPYLVKLEPGHKFTEWLLDNCFGRHWGIFAVTKVEMPAMRKHFRTFLMVQGPDGKPVYFRYYDPRVLRLYLPTCNEDETAQVYGPVIEYWLEDETAEKLLRFSVSKMLAQKDDYSIA